LLRELGYSAAEISALERAKVTVTS
jgi:hypothetical protein